MLGHRKPRSVVADTLQMFAKTTPDASSDFTNVKKRASKTRYAVRKILGLGEEMVTDSKVAFRASYLGERTYVVEGMAPGTLTRT